MSVAAEVSEVKTGNKIWLLPDSRRVTIDDEIATLIFVKRYCFPSLT